VPTSNHTWMCFASGNSHRHLRKDATRRLCARKGHFNITMVDLSLNKVSVVLGVSWLSTRLYLVVLGVTWPGTRWGSAGSSVVLGTLFGVTYSMYASRRCANVRIGTFHT